jgi:hypothetical protein
MESNRTTLAVFLIAQALAILGAVITLTSYMVKLEARVNTLEVRGSPHLNVVDNRLTVLEKITDAQQKSIERIVDVMTKELHIQPQRDK